MSRVEKWQINRLTRNKTSQSSKRQCIPENQHQNFEWSNEEFPVGQTYQPVFVESLKMNKETVSQNYQADKYRCDMLGETGKHVTVDQNKPELAWNSHQHGKEALHVHQNAGVWDLHLKLDTAQTIYKPNDEEFSVWKAYKPILDKEEPMEVDDVETFCPRSPTANTGFTAFGPNGNPSTLQKSEATSAYNSHQHGNEFYQNANVYLHQRILNNGQIVYEPEEFSVWKAYKLILDKEEPMEVDEDKTPWPMFPAGFNIPAESRNQSNTCQTMYEPEEFSVWKAYKPILDAEEPMDIDNPDETYQRQNARYVDLQSEKDKSMLSFWECFASELEKDRQMNSDEREAERFREETIFAISSAENFQDLDFEIPEEIDEAQDNYLTDEEFQLWLEEQITLLEEEKEAGDK